VRRSGAEGERAESRQLRGRLGDGERMDGKKMRR